MPRLETATMTGTGPAKYKLKTAATPDVSAVF